MREFKFRAWDNEYKYMNYKVLVGNVWDTDINYTAHAMWIEPKYVSYKKEAGWCHFDEHSNIKLMQYTGLKDKNGIEIYEGDIVYLSEKGLTEIAFPFIELYQACYENDIGNIVGNIYENPELLEQE